MPPDLLRYTRTWAQHHPNWLNILWTDCKQLPGENHELRKIPPLENKTLYDAAQTGQMKADILRYELLYKYGGVYVDVDFECKKPIDDFLTKKCFFAWETTNKWINNAIIGAEPGNDFIGSLVDGLPKRDLNQRANISTGPQYVTAMYNQLKPESVAILDKDLFYPYLWNELGRAGEEFPNAYAVHHWNNARRRQARAATR